MFNILFYLRKVLNATASQQKAAGSHMKSTERNKQKGTFHVSILMEISRLVS